MTQDNSPLGDIAGKMDKAVDGGPAFPQLSIESGERDGHGDLIDPITASHGGMTLRSYAAIKLKVPDSGIDWLDDMIRASKRDEFAGMALQGMLAYDGGGELASEHKAYAMDAYSFADEMLKAGQS